jgi:hypothetical protein
LPFAPSVLTSQLSRSREAFEVGAGRGVLRVEFHGASQVRTCVVEQARLGEGATEVAVGGWRRWCQFHRALKMDEGLRQTILRKQGDAKLLMRFCKVRIERNRPTIFAHRFGHGALPLENFGEVEMQMLIPRRQR